MPTISSIPLDQGSPPSSHLRHSHHRLPTQSSLSTIPVPVSSSPDDFSSSTPPSASCIPTSATPAAVAAPTTRPSTFTSTTGFTGSVIGSISRRNRRSFAALAREKTSNAFANLSAIGGTTNATLRSSASSGSLSKHSRKPSQVSVSEAAGASPLTPPLSDSSTSSEQLSNTPIESPFNPISPAVAEQVERRRQTLQHVPSLVGQQAQAVIPSKMHQTSSRLLRMTEDDRPFTKDFMDLFSTLMVSLKLDSHRVRFTRYDHSFTSEEAINNLGSLKFSQSNRMPDPKDPSRIVTTTTTTTFSMAKEMARSVCQRFVDARFIESVDGKASQFFPLKGALYQLTPKGINILQRFCQRNGITARHVIDVLESPRNTMQLVNLERDSETDKLSHDRATIEVIFRRFAGQDGPNVKSSISTSDSDSLSDYSNGLVGVKMAKERKINDKIVINTFTGKAAVDWLMDCSTTIERRETVLIAELFVKYGMITMLQEDKLMPLPDNSIVGFQPSKNAIYGITERGQRVCGWIARDKSRETTAYDSRGIPKDSNNARLNHILHDPALRLLFREFLRYSLCEENLSFYLDVSEFTATYHKAEKVGTFKKSDSVRETLAAAYGLYNAFLAPGSPCELNIDHALRNSLASRMTKAVGDDESMFKSLQEVVHLFEMAQTSVFKLMSSDSIPKFLRDPKYAHILQEHDVELIGATRSYSPTPANVPERSMSRSARS
ncbi:regulator of G protein signaling domain-containing protein [Aspergillus caelatus]|uniref:Regulator of G protein signaling domain-containing protein n=2 Tax=Aspergillus subgen. Circumdati TaxID=2720871 RepID=A0A5N6ZKP0_9EURO|nr:regulator of G protein signaling domain-containing protein [Aspergillus caelatus]KAE8357369.1 regulator of G protein signaling domain-containing protein [Aspergillus caelatus]KAE8417308.1 regulator of G protein signaling domain-containing protein [Aspergillus pseudocaelatus]